MVLVRLAFRYLWERKLRSFLTILAVMFGVMIIFGTKGIIPAVEETFRRNLMTAANAVDLTVTSTNRGVFSQEKATGLAAVEGVSTVSASLVRPVLLPEPAAPRTTTGQPVGNLIVNGIDPATVYTARNFRLESGQLLEPGSDNQVLITGSLAEKTGLAVGDSLSLPAATGLQTFEIAGVLTGRGLPGAEEIYITLPAAQALFHQAGQINTLEAMFVPGVNVEEVRAQALQVLGPGFKTGENQSGEELMASVQMGEVAFTLFGVLALAMGGFVIFNTFRTLVYERRRDTGMLRAVGATPQTILGVLLVESLLQGVIGTALGLLFGYLMALGLMQAIAPLWQEYLQMTVGRPSFSAGVYLQAIGMGIGVTLLGGLLPALSASRTTVLDALRPSGGPESKQAGRARLAAGLVILLLAFLGLVSGDLKFSSLGAVLFLVGLVILGPALIAPLTRLTGRLLGFAFAREGRIAQGNLVRQPGRASVTASAMTIGLAIIVALGGMVSTIESAFSNYLDKSLGADYLLMPQSLVLSGGNVAASPELASSIAQVDGVGLVTSLRITTSRADDTDVQVVGIDPVTYPQVASLEFSAGDESAFEKLGQGRYLIANGIFASQNGVKVGQQLTLETNTGPQSYEVIAIGMDYLNAKLATVYASQANLEQDFHETGDMLLMANLEPGATAAATEAHLRELVAGYPNFMLVPFTEWRTGIMNGFNQAMSVMYILMIALALPSLIALMNTLGISVLERRREIGMLRAVGAAGGQVQRMILAESLLLASAGVAFGILAGIWLGYILVAAMNTSGFVMPYYFPYSGILLAVAAGMMFAVLAALLPARQAVKADIVTALRYE